MFDYDAMGNLRTVSLPDGRTIEYIIDGRNRRVGKKVDGVLVQGFVYLDQLNPAAELDGSGAVVSEFVYGTRVNVPEYIERDGHTYRVVADHLGSPRLVVDVSTGNTEQLQRFDSFGRLQNTPSGFQPFGFAGGIWDADTGLVRFGARDYDPSTGRWMAKDPIRFGGGSTGLFSYLSQEPVNSIDPSGLFDIVVLPNAPGGDANAEWAADAGWEGAALMVGILVVGIAIDMLPALMPMMPGFIQRGCDNPGRWTAPRIVANQHGQLTNTIYTIDKAGMSPHLVGSLSSGKSQFLFRVNAEQIVLDAAAYANEAGLWAGNKAKVVLDSVIGVHAGTGSPTNVLNLYRTVTGFVHGTPGTPL